MSIWDDYEDLIEGGVGFGTGSDPIKQAGVFETEEERKAREEAKAAEEAEKAKAYQLNPNNPNYVQQTAGNIRDASLQGAGNIHGTAQASQTIGQQANQALGAAGTAAQQQLSSAGLKARQQIGNYGLDASGEILDVAQAGQGALVGAAGREADRIAAAGTTGIAGLQGTARLGAGDVAAAGENAQQAISAYGLQAARGVGSAGQNALGALTDYGMLQGGMLGGLGMDAAQAARFSGDSAAARAVQQGQAIGGASTGAAGGASAGAVAQSNAINQFAAQQAAAQAAAQGRAYTGPDYAAANAIYGQAGMQAADLAALEAVEGPSAAQAQLQAGLNAAQASNLAMARSGRGWGGGASALSQAAAQNAQAGQQAANQAATLRAQEAAAWRQRQAANLGAAAGIQTGLGERTAAQTQFAGELALRQQALSDQTALGYGGQQLGALTDAGNLALQGQLGAGDLALRGGTAGADLALRGALGGGELGLSGAQLQGQLAGEGARLGLDAMSTGQNLNVQAARDAAAIGSQNLAAAYGFGTQGAQSAAEMQLRAADAAARLGLESAGMSAGTRMGGLEAGYGMGLEGTRSAADVGLGALETGYGMQIGAMGQGAELGLQGLGQGAELGLQGAGQAGALYGASTQQYLSGIGMENQLYGQEAGLRRSQIQDDLTKYGIDKGVAVQQQQLNNQMLGAGLSTGAALLPILLTALSGSDRDAKTGIEPAGEIRMPMSGPPITPGLGAGRSPKPLGPGGADYDRAMGSAARASRIYGSEQEGKNLIGLSPDRQALMNMAEGNLQTGLQRAGGMLQSQPINPYMYNPYASRYLTSDVNAKTEIEQLRGQGQMLGGTPPAPTSQAGMAAMQASGLGANAGLGLTGGMQPSAGAPSLGQPAMALPTQAAPQAAIATAQPSGFARRPMPAAPATAAQQPGSTARLGLGTAMPARASLTPDTASLPRDGAMLGGSPAPMAQKPGVGLGPDAAAQPSRMDAYRRTRGLVASDERSKMRVAQLEGQVMALGGDPNASTSRMPLAYDPGTGVAGLYREYDPSAESTGGFRRSDGSSGSPWDVASRVDRAALDEAYRREAGLEPARGTVTGPPAARPTVRDISREDFFPGNYRVLGAAADTYSPYSNVDVAALDDAYRRETGMEPMLPSREAAARAIEKAPAYSYEYRDPERFGEGRYIGPMAQDLEKTPEGKSVVKEAPDGTKMIDTSRLSLLNTAALSQMQERIDELENERAGKRKAPAYSPYNFDRDALDAAYARSLTAPGIY